MCDVYFKFSVFTSNPLYEAWRRCRPDWGNINSQLFAFIEIDGNEATRQYQNHYQAFLSLLLPPPSSFLPRLPSHPGPGVPTWGSIQISAFNKILLPSSSLSICLLCQPHILLIENSPPRVRNTSFLSLFSDLFSYLSTLIFLLWSFCSLCSTLLSRVIKSEEGWGWHWEGATAGRRSAQLLTSWCTGELRRVLIMLHQLWLAELQLEMCYISPDLHSQQLDIIIHYPRPVRTCAVNAEYSSVLVRWRGRWGSGK